MRMQSDPNQPQGPFDPYQQQWTQQPQWQQPMQQGQMQWQQDPMQQQWAQQQPQWQQPWQQLTPEQIQQMQYEAYMQQTPQMPTMQQPVQEVPQKRRKKKVKKSGGGGGLSWWKTALALVLIAGVAWYFLKDMIGQPQLSTAVVEMGSIGETHTGDALIVRNETAFDDEGVQNIEYVAQEGSVVYRGDVICYVYSTGYSTKEMTTLQDYRDQIKDYQQTLLKSETAYDQKMTRLESEVVQRGLEVRALVQGARGNLSNQETILKTAITQRQAYFRSKYSSDMRLNRLFDDESTQQQRIDSWIKQKVATQESIVSFYTDGYEYALTPSEYEKYTPSQVRSMINGQRPETSTAARGRTDLYRLVRQNNYAVLMLVKDSDWNPVEGTTYKLVLEQFTNTVVDAQVLSFTRSGGELLLRLAVIGDVSDVLYMRTCSAQLGEYVDCLKVPQSALYVKNDANGVVLVTPDQQVFVPVNVLRKEGGMAYITPVQGGTLSSGNTVRLFK
ncbi:MAG: hypothetical protein J6K55_08295 [Clostridia bacterium]|nr:hypothetical protein [Clostridia bacterium]